MKAGDVIKFVKYEGNDIDPSSVFHLHGKVGILITKRLESWALDWGAAWDVFVGNKIHHMCYERWMDVISENR